MLRPKIVVVVVLWVPTGGRGLSVRASIWVQASNSQASSTMTHQMRFWSNPCNSGFTQSAVPGGTDAVFAAGPATVTQFQGRQLPGGGVGGECGQSQSVAVR